MEYILGFLYYYYYGMDGQRALPLVDRPRKYLNQVADELGPFSNFMSYHVDFIFWSESVFQEYVALQLTLSA